MVPPKEEEKQREDIDATATAVSDIDETAPEETEDSLDPVSDDQFARDSSAGAGAEPTRLGRYVLLREIGAGAIGVVYAAYHEGLDRKLAIKVLNRQRAGRVDLEARLRREARALAKLSHPNVVQVYDVGEFEGRVFVAMEFVEGQTLSCWMQREHSLDEKIAMFVAAGRGLAAAHRAGVIHRDFKPDNVLVGSDDRPRVLDFGLARAIEHSRSVAPPQPVTRHRTEPLVANLAQLLHTGSSAHAVARSASGNGSDPDATLDPDAPPDPPARPRLSVLNLDAPGEQPRDPNVVVLTTREDEIAVDVYTLETKIDHDPEFAITLMSEPGPAAEVDDDDDGVITRDGALMGTPAYMSPEQFVGKRVDQASDQFSFCVALYEALYGHRPFAGENALQLALGTQAGQIADAPANSEVPARLRQIIVRGLSPQPEARFESMEALLSALEHDPGQRRRQRWLAVLGIGTVAALAFVVGTLGPAREPLCPSVDAIADELWTPVHALELGGVFAASQLPYANAAWSAVEQRLGPWTRLWAQQRVEACEATHVRQEFSAEVLDLRQACLDRGRQSFEALTRQLASGEAPVIERAVEATAALPDPARCNDVAALLTDVVAPPQAVATQVDQLREQLAEIDTLANFGRWKQGLPRAKQVIEQARETRYGPVIAEALLVYGRLLSASGSSPEALAALQAALDEAERHAHDELVPRVATELASLSIYTRTDPVRGRIWAQRALTALDRIDEGGHARARGLWALGNIERLDGANTQAEAHLREAIELLDEHAADHPDRAIMLNDLGVALEAQGQLEPALETYEHALTQSIASFGPGHPRVGNAHYNLARLAFAEGRFDHARTQLDRAHEIYAKALGPKHRDVGSVELLAANIALAEGEIDDATVHALRVKDIYEAELAPDNVDRAEPDLILGHIAFTRKDLEGALLHYRACLATQRAALPPGHIEMAVTLGNLGRVHLERSEHDAAVDYLGQALALLEAGERRPEGLRDARYDLGDALMARAGAGDHRRAAAQYEAAFEGCARSPVCTELALRAARAHAKQGHAAAVARWVGVARPLVSALDSDKERSAVLAELAQLAKVAKRAKRAKLARAD